jgi:hypothetical protein
MLRLVTFDQDGQNVQTIAFRRPDVGIRVAPKSLSRRRGSPAQYVTVEYPSSRLQLDGFRIDRIVLGVGADEFDVDHANPVAALHNQ